MTRNLWIGSPWSGLREITQAARSWDRSADLGVTEFRSLDGAVTVSRGRFTPRRTKLSWEGMTTADARALDVLARRAVGFGNWNPYPSSRTPVALIDPVAGNLLSAYQAAGCAGPADAEKAWYAVSGSVTFTALAADGWTVRTGTAATAVGWRHGGFPGWPVAPGMTVSWALPDGWDAVGTTAARLDWLGPDGSLNSSTTAAGRTVSGTARTGDLFVLPVGVPGAAAVTLGLANACLTIDEPAVPGTPGDGCPAVAVTAYTDVPAARLPLRNVSIDLLEVNSAIR